MADKKKPRHERMYSKKPHLERGEDGHMDVKEKEPTAAVEEADAAQSGVDGVKVNGEGMPAHARHAHERRDMHNRHETEHAVHDNGKHGEKKEMHERHAKEMKDMHKRHQKEIDAGEHKDQDIKEGRETGKDTGE